MSTPKFQYAPTTDSVLQPPNRNMEKQIDRHISQTRLTLKYRITVMLSDQRETKSLHYVYVALYTETTIPCITLAETHIKFHYFDTGCTWNEYFHVQPLTCLVPDAAAYKYASKLLKACCASYAQGLAPHALCRWCWKCKTTDFLRWAEKSTLAR